MLCTTIHTVQIRKTNTKFCLLSTVTIFVNIWYSRRLPYFNKSPHLGLTLTFLWKFYFQPLFLLWQTKFFRSEAITLNETTKNKNTHLIWNSLYCVLQPFGKSTRYITFLIFITLRIHLKVVANTISGKSLKLTKMVFSLETEFHINWPLLRFSR